MRGKMPSVVYGGPSLRMQIRDESRDVVKKSITQQKYRAKTGTHVFYETSVLFCLRLVGAWPVLGFYTFTGSRLINGKHEINQGP
jgi:hypothetical protein